MCNTASVCQIKCNSVSVKCHLITLSQNIIKEWHKAFMANLRWGHLIAGVNDRIIITGGPVNDHITIACTCAKWCYPRLLDKSHPIYRTANLWCIYKWSGVCMWKYVDQGSQSNYITFYNTLSNISTTPYQSQVVCNCIRDALIHVVPTEISLNYHLSWISHLNVVFNTYHVPLRMTFRLLAIFLCLLLPIFFVGVGVGLTWKWPNVDACWPIIKKRNVNIIFLLI